jgi:hypothetical protein
MTGDNWTNTMLAGMLLALLSSSCNLSNALGMKYSGIYLFVYFIAVWFIGQFIYQTSFTGILLSQFDDLNVKSVKLVKDEKYGYLLFLLDFVSLPCVLFHMVLSFTDA